MILNDPTTDDTDPTVQMILTDPTMDDTDPTVRMTPVFGVSTSFCRFCCAPA